MSASDPLQGARGTGCPVFWWLLGLVTLESLITAEHDGHGEPARTGVRNYWATDCMAPFWFKAFSVFPDST